MAGNAPAFGSSELRLTAKQALFPAAWPRQAMKRLLRRGGWLGRQDSNLRMPVPKTGALPLGYAPLPRAGPRREHNSNAEARQRAALASLGRNPARRRAPLRR